MRCSKSYCGQRTPAEHQYTQSLAAERGLCVLPEVLVQGCSCADITLAHDLTPAQRHQPVRSTLHVQHTPTIRLCVHCGHELHNNGSSRVRRQSTGLSALSILLQPVVSADAGSNTALTGCSNGNKQQVGASMEPAKTSWAWHYMYSRLRSGNLWNLQRPCACTVHNTYVWPLGFRQAQLGAATRAQQLIERHPCLHYRWPITSTLAATMYLVLALKRDGGHPRVACLELLLIQTSLLAQCQQRRLCWSTQGLVHGLACTAVTASRNTTGNLAQCRPMLTQNRPAQCC